jgi:hypothetical protein
MAFPNSSSLPLRVYLSNETMRWRYPEWFTDAPRQQIRTQIIKSNEIIKINAGENITNIKLNDPKYVKSVQLVVGGIIINELHTAFHDFTKPLPLFASLFDMMNNVNSSLNPIPFFKCQDTVIVINGGVNTDSRYLTCTVDIVNIDIVNVDMQSQKFVGADGQSQDLIFEKYNVLHNYYAFREHGSEYEIRYMSHMPTTCISIAFTTTNASKPQNITLNIVPRDGSLPYNIAFVPLFRQNKCSWHCMFPMTKLLAVNTSTELLSTGGADVRIIITGNGYGNFYVEHTYTNILRYIDEMCGYAYSSHEQLVRTLPVEYIDLKFYDKHEVDDTCEVDRGALSNISTFIGSFFC